MQFLWIKTTQHFLIIFIHSFLADKCKSDSNDDGDRDKIDKVTKTVEDEGWVNAKN
jgi:hypothetical protein